ncbi:hypothetical protein KP509_21G051400 [Ceratopteris richardii]|nr:hypothetical protein KP509_21G051400 [Ceratopteris richardii]
MICYERMQQVGLSPDAVTYASLFKACTMLGAIEKGDEIYNEILRQSLVGRDLVLDNAILDMYAKSGALVKAQKFLEALPIRDIISWSTLIAGYVQHGLGHEALDSFVCMQNEGITPDTVSLIPVIKACGMIGAVAKGQEVYDFIMKQEHLRKNVVLGSALVDMFMKFGFVSRAAHVLQELPQRNVVSWSVLIAGYVRHEQHHGALKCFDQMKQDGVFPNEVTFMSALRACASLGDLETGKQLHDEINGLEKLDNHVELRTALVDMYVKCGSLTRAHQVVENLVECDAVPWNVLIAGYIQQDREEESLNCFEIMQQKGVIPDTVTFALILKGCGNFGATIVGENIHHQILRLGLAGSCTRLGIALMDMYVKFGAPEKAHRVLVELPLKDAVSWSILIAGYAQCGKYHEVLQCMDRMEYSGVSPNVVTFSALLNVCKNSGLVDEGEYLFVSMAIIFDIVPDLEHYLCMIDLYSRAGNFNKALKLTKRMPSSDHPALWSSLLGACRKWENVKLGRWAFEHAIQSDPNDITPYIDMANIYEAAGMQKDANIIESMRERFKACQRMQPLNSILHLSQECV